MTSEEALSQILNWDSDVEEEISETEDLSETEDNVIADPDCQFSYDEEDSEDESAVVPPTDENRSPAAAAVIEKVKLRSPDQPAASPNPTSPNQHPVDTGGKRRKICQVCPSREDSKTSTSCVKCKNYICRKHTVTFCPSCGEH